MAKVEVLSSVLKTQLLFLPQGSLSEGARAAQQCPRWGSLPVGAQGTNTEQHRISPGCNQQYSY